ncbi:MAG: ABC transporter substrate-binding protein [Enterocloster sp.]
MAESLSIPEYDIDYPFAKTQGLPNLGNARIEIIAADSQGNPEVGATEAERLITEEKVTGLIGCDASGVTKTASALWLKSTVFPSYQCRVFATHSYGTRVKIFFPYRTLRMLHLWKIRLTIWTSIGKRPDLRMWQS